MSVATPIERIAAAQARVAPAGGPAWSRRRSRALDVLAARGLPDRRDENWKYLDHARIAEHAFEVAPRAPVDATALEDQANLRCPLVVCADPEGLARNEQAQISASRANLLYIAGGGTLATAMVLWLVGAPDEAKVVPTAGDRQLGVALSGRF